MTGRRVRPGTSSLRLLFLALLVSLGLPLGGAPARADTVAPLPASLSGVTREKGDLLGVLTVRGGGSAADIDPRTVSATIAGEPVELKVEPITRAPRRAMLVVDTSGSMGNEGMQTAQAAAKSFIDAAPKDVLIGLVSFANTAGVDVPLTADRVRLGKAVDALVSDGETALYAAIQSAVAALGPTGERSIILLSDGGDTMAKNKARDAAAAVAALKSGGIRAEVVAFNTDESDTKVLQQFATAGGGSVTQAGNASGVKAAFTAAANALDSQIRWRVTAPADLVGAPQLTVTGQAGSRPFSAETTIDLGALPVASGVPTTNPAEQPQSSSPQGFAAPGMSWVLPVAVGTLFLGVFGLVTALLAPAFQTRRARRVAGVETYLPDRELTSRTRPKGTPTSALTTSLVAFGDKRMADRKSTTRTMALIERADLPLRAGEWWLLRVLGLVVGAAVGYLLFRGLIGLVVGVVAAFALPPLVLRFLAARRSKQFDNQLPDALMLVSSSLGAGFSLNQALDAVAKDSAEPLSKEFSRALAEARIGADVAESLERVGERMDSENTRWTAMAIRIQRDVGGNLAETLRTTAQTIRERHALQRHVAALSAEGRLSAYILIALPIGLFLYMMLVNREYISLLWTTVLGVLMLLVAVVLLVVGIFWMSKTVKVEV